MKQKLCMIALSFTLTVALATTSVFACTTIIVGKDKTADGSVLFAHSEELGDDSAQHLVYVPAKTYPSGTVWKGISSGTEIPQVTKTYAYIASTLFDKEYYPGDYTSGVNEHQVTIGNNMSWTKDVPDDDNAWDLNDNGIIWTEYTQLVLERCKTAREGVELIGQLHEKHKLSGDPGTMYAIADPNEGFIIELSKHGQWIAQRVPDNSFLVLPNAYTIGVVDLDDSANILHSADIVTFAESKGWYTPATPGDYSDFSFKDAYGAPENQDDEYNLLRIKMVGEMLTQDPVTKEKLMEVMRTAYEGTKYYQEDQGTGSPFHTDVRTISRINTEVSAVVQLRRDLPAELGATVWWALATSKTSPYVPWYFGATNIPAPYQKGTNEDQTDSAYWAYRNLSLLVDENYSKTIGKVSKTWSDFEANEFASQAAIEAEAKALWDKNQAPAAIKLLNDYSYAKAMEAYGLVPGLMSPLYDIDNHWAKDYIQYVYEQQLFQGVNATTFSPNTTVTRGMFVTILGRLARVDTASYENVFTDIPDDSYYAPYASWAKQNNIVSGTGEGIFSGNRAITREEMSVMLNNYIQFAEIELNEGSAKSFSDSDAVSSWAQSSVDALSASGVIDGMSDGTFAPAKTATRAEAATLFARFMQTYME